MGDVPDYRLTPHEQFVQGEMRKQTELLDMIQHNICEVSQAIRVDNYGGGLLITEERVG